MTNNYANANTENPLDSVFEAMVLDIEIWQSRTDALQSFVNSKPAPSVGFNDVLEVKRLKCDRDNEREKSRQLELDLRNRKLLELFTYWPKFAFGINFKAISLSGDTNKAHMKNDTQVWCCC